MAKKSYQGKDIEITFDGSLCIHARECVTSLPKVFVANAPGDWIQRVNPHFLTSEIRTRH